MKSTLHIGRVGVLAVALGIGWAVGSAPVAAADGAETSEVSATTSSAGSAAPPSLRDRIAKRQQSHPREESASDDDAAEGEPTPKQRRRSGRTADSIDGSDSSDRSSVSDRATASKHWEKARAVDATGPDGWSPSRHSSASDAADDVESSSTGPDIGPVDSTAVESAVRISAPASTPEPPVAENASAPTATTATLTRTVSPLLGAVPGTGAVDFAGLWVLMAAARRQVGADLGTPAVLAAVASNSLPTAKGKAKKPNSATGVVTGTIRVTDRDRDPVTYTVYTDHTKGEVTVDARGRFIYTPTATARHAASAVGASTAVKTDTVTIAMDDGKGVIAYSTLTVSVGPKNAAPTASSTVGQPNPSTGVVTGNVVATDSDGDSFVFTAPATTRKGTVSVAADGSFTYTPTAAARLAAGKANASSSVKTDSFTVTVTDGHGGKATTTVKVAIAPPGAVDASTFTGVGVGRVVIGTTGTGYQLVTGFSLVGPKPPTRVIVIDPDGSMRVTGTIVGAPLPVESGGLVVAENGGVLLTTYDGSKTVVSLIKPDATVVSSAAVAGRPADVLVLGADGTGYQLTGGLSEARTSHTVIRATAGGTFSSYTVTGAVYQTVQAGADGSAYLAYQDGQNAKLLVFSSNGSSKTVSIAGEQYLGVGAGLGATAYVTTIATNASGDDVGKLYTIVNGVIADSFTLPGIANGTPVVTATGEAYQVSTYSGTTGSPVTFVDKVYITAFTAAGPVTTATDGELLPVFQAGSDAYPGIVMAPNGTGYLLIGPNSEGTTFPRIAVIAPSGAVTFVSPGNFSLYTADRLVVGPDNKLYIGNAFGSALIVGPDGTKTTTNGSGIDLTLAPNGQAYGAAYAGTGSVAVRNLTTGQVSASVSGGRTGDGEYLAIGADGTVYLKSFTDVDGEVTGVNILAVRPDTSTIASISVPGAVSAYLTPSGSDGLGYVTIVSPDDAEGVPHTAVWRIGPSGATQVANYAGFASDGATIGTNGAVYITIVDSLTSTSATGKVHRIAPV